MLLLLWQRQEGPDESPSKYFPIRSAKFVNKVINSYRYHSVIFMYRIMGSVQAENRQRSELIVSEEST
jgi:hypothetical protein